MVEQIGRNSAAIGPVLATTKIVLRVVRNLRRQAELVTQPHVPIDVILTVRARTRGWVDRVLRYVTLLPVILIVVFTAIWLSDRAKGGYRTVELAAGRGAK